MSTDAANPTGGPSLPQERRLVTAIPGPRSMELQARKSAAVSAGVSGLLPVFVVAGAGAVLVDVDGNSLIDMGSGIAVTNVGHCSPPVVQAVQQQVADLMHTCFTVTHYESYVAVCEALNELTPGDHPKRSALFNAGAEAVENAIKIARAHTGRQAIVSFEHAYHGRTNLTMALTGRNMPFKHSFGPFAPEIYRFPLSYPLHDGLSGPEAAARSIERIATEIGADNVAAIIIEPIIGEGGFIVPADGFLPALLHFSREHGIVFIADEIQSGFCRTGEWFACDHEGIVPDLMTTAKAIAGGLPLAAVTGTAEIMDAVHPGGLGGTYAGNPVACAAALAAIEQMREADLNAAARRIGSQMWPRLADVAERTGRIGEVRGRGAMIAVEVVVPGTTNPDPEAAAAVVRYCHSEGVVVLKAGNHANVLRFLPPLVIGEALLDEALGVIEDAFTTLE